MVVVSTLTATPGAALHYKSRACAQHVTRGIQARERYLRCEHRRIEPPGSAGYALQIARCESGADLMAPRGPVHGGTYQHRNDLWPGRFDHYTQGRHPRDGELRPNIAAFRSQVIVTFRMARAGSWGPWSCA